MSDAAMLGRSASKKELHTELLRKSIHMMVAFVPTFARFNLLLTFFALSGAVFLYSYAEFMRIKGIKVPFISNITSSASRSKDRDFVLGPVTLALGALMALILYPEPAAAVAIYALAFGDGFASLFGKLFGRRVIPFSGGKTFAGSSACLISVFLVTLSISGSVKAAVIISIATTFIEVIPSGDLDNMLIPVGTGLIAALIM